MKKSVERKLETALNKVLALICTEDWSQMEEQKLRNAARFLAVLLQEHNPHHYILSATYVNSLLSPQD